VTKNYIALFTTLFLLVTGCSVERNIKIDARLSLPPVVRQLPLHIGVHYNPEFIEFTNKFELIGCGPNGRRDKTYIFFIFPIGVASRDFFEQCISGMFASVQPISDPHQFSKQLSPIDGWLEPKIESFNWETDCTNDFLSDFRFISSIAYSVNLYDSNSQLVTSIKFRGLSFVNVKDFKFQDNSLGAERAIQDAMGKFMIDFYDLPEVQQWLSNHVVVPGSSQ
jgi:hypothetical protein